MNEALARLHPYPFEKLAALRRDLGPPPSHLRHIDLSIGEPRHSAPSAVLECLRVNLEGVQRYPATAGTPELRAACASWLERREGLPAGSIDRERGVVPVNGTREGLFAIAQCLVDRRRPAPVVAMPNPFYQIYEGAALLAGAEPCYLNALEENGHLPDLAAVPESTWARCQLLYLCSPANPTGNVLPEHYLARALELADKHEFVIVADECYSEIYLDEQRPPAGLLAVAARLGRGEFRRCLVFHSLSKRSNVPGMRSGFCAGDPALVSDFLRYRTYHGCAMPLHHQAASALAWGDEAHVAANRALYRRKFDAVLEVLGPVLPVERPEAGFYLWPRLPIDEVAFAAGLMEHENVTVLPGSFLARPSAGVNPGARRARIALVPSLEDCLEAAHRIRRYVETLH